jgi:hypothetical protein
MRRSPFQFRRTGPGWRVRFRTRTVANVGLSQTAVRRTLETILAHVPDSRFCLVGTASCLLRGIDVPASDVDILFRTRDGVEAWVASLTDLVEVNDAPTWLEESRQYFARVSVSGVTVELSTVEIDDGTDTGECVGAGPWAHFDPVPCGEFNVPTVSVELRLVTEVARQRRDRWEPIVAYFRSHPCDIALVERGLANMSTSPDEISAVLKSLTVG